MNFPRTFKNSFNLESLEIILGSTGILVTCIWKLTCIFHTSYSRNNFISAVSGLKKLDIQHISLLNTAILNTL